MERHVNFVRARIPDGKTNKKQTLPFDKKILCEECDRRLGVFDQTLIEFVRSYFAVPERKTPPKSPNELIVVNVPVDTQRLKLAIAGLLLRMSYSNDVPQVNLGGTYEELFADWMKSGEILNSEDEALDIEIIGHWEDDFGLDRMIVIQPKMVKDGGAHYYIFEMVMGLTIIAKVGRGRWTKHLEKHPKIGTFPLDSIELPLCDPRSALHTEHLTRMHNQLHRNK